MNRRSAFRDPESDRRFAADGYLVIDLPRPDVIPDFARRFDELYVGRREGFHSSLESSDYAYRDALHEAVTATFGHVVDEFFVGHRVVMSAATVKWARTPSSELDDNVNIHQDWSLVDERAFRSLNVWIPLVDTSADNGGLYVLPGSHLRFQQLRPHGGFPSWYSDPAMQLDPDTFHPVHIRAGQALIMDHALLHRSPRNNSSSPRIAVVMGITPREATISHCHLGPDDTITRYTIEDPAFFRRVVAYQDPAPILSGMPTEVVAFDGVPPRPESTLSSGGPGGASRFEAVRSHLRRWSRAISGKR